MRVRAVEDQLLSAFDGLPTQLQIAARWLLDNGNDVAFLSMREAARRANVTPATMTRLAQRLGYDGFASLRTRFTDAVRASTRPFRQRAEGLRARRDLDGDAALITDTLAVVSGHLKALCEPDTLAAMGRAADIIQSSRQVCWVGARSGFAPVYLGSYLMSLIGGPTRLLDQAGGIGLDALGELTPSDALIAVSIAPYTTQTVEAVAYAAERGVQVIAVTDSRAAPIARPASVSIIVPTETPSFLHTMTPAFIVVECLAALVAARRGQAAVDAIARAEVLFDRLGSYASPTLPKRSR